MNISLLKHTEKLAIRKSFGYGSIDYKIFEWKGYCYLSNDNTAKWCLFS